MYCNISVIICLVYFIFTCSWIRDSIYCITYSIKMKENSALVKPQIYALWLENSSWLRYVPAIIGLVLGVDSEELKIS